MADPKLIAPLSSLLGPLPGVKEKQLLFRTHTKETLISTEAAHSFIVSSFGGEICFSTEAPHSSPGHRNPYHNTPRTGFSPAGNTVSPNSCRRLISIVVVIAVRGTS
jgi:hypothetical protein